MVLNKTIMMGRMVADPELKKTNSDMAVCNFTLAVDKPKGKNAENAEANFIDCVAWRGTAEIICKFFHKGSRIIVDGAIQTRTYKDKSDNNRKVTEVVVNDFSFVDRKSDSDTQKQESTSVSSAQSVNVEPSDDEDLPW